MFDPQLCTDIKTDQDCGGKAKHNVAESTRITHLAEIV